jgi:ADP-ribose pyrophosphatase
LQVGIVATTGPGCSNDFPHTHLLRRIITLNVEQVELPNGSVADLEIAHHPGGAAVVAVDDARRVCMLRQYRHAAGGWLHELPAGKLDNREPPLDCATRELAEEAGRAAQRWRPLGEYLSSPGVLPWSTCSSPDLCRVVAKPEEHEVLEVHTGDSTGAQDGARRSYPGRRPSSGCSGPPTPGPAALSSLMQPGRQSVAGSDSPNLGFYGIRTDELIPQAPQMARNLKQAGRRAAEIERRRAGTPR